MAALKNPNGQIPNGLKFYSPATKWSPAPFSSLDSIVTQLIGHRQGRPDLVQKFGWSLDPAVVRQEVEQYNVALCVQNGWKDYITGDEQSAPFRARSESPLRKLANVAGGSQTLVEWLSEGAKTVAQEAANRRAETCAGCPMNGQGGWETYFTVPVSNAIRREVGKKHQMNLRTPSDEKLGVCTGCSCPLLLKVWLPIENITAKMTPEQRASLDPRCWILSEGK